MRQWFLVLPLVFTFWTTATPSRFASAAPPSPSPKDVAAEVNGKAITYEVLNTTFHNQRGVPFEKVQDDPQAQQVRKEILEQMINEELLAEEAQRQELQVAQEAIDERIREIRTRFPSEEAFKQAVHSSGLTLEQLTTDIKEGLMIQQLIQKEVIAKVSVSPQELEAFFQKHKNDYVEESVRARHILIKVAPDASPEADGKAKDRANAVLAKAKKGEDFGKLAQEYSEDPSKDRGGDLGYLGRGQTVKPFEDAAFSLKVGEIGGPIRTTFGYHIIKVEDRTAPKRLSLQEAEDRVKADATKEKAAAEYQKYANGLRKKGKVTVNLK